MATIAFLGLGNMGGPMAKNLLAAGHQLTVFDLVEAACAALAAEGASVAASAAEAAGNADVIISMLPAGKHVAGTFLGDDGLLATIPKDTLILDASTIDAATARQVGEAAADVGIDFMDTPVSGGVAAAAAGTLAFMCGGTASALAARDRFSRAWAVRRKFFMRARRGQVRSPRPPTTCCSRCI